MGILFGKPFWNGYWAQYHTIKAGLVAEVYACAKRKIEERLRVYGTP